MIKKIKKKEAEEIEAEMDKELGLDIPQEDAEKELKYIG